MAAIVLPDRELEQLAERFRAANLSHRMTFEQFCALPARMRDDLAPYREGSLLA